MNKEERTLQEYKEEIFDRIDENTKLEWLYELSKKCCHYEERIDKAIEYINNCIGIEAKEELRNILKGDSNE